MYKNSYILVIISLYLLIIVQTNAQIPNVRKVTTLNHNDNGEVKCDIKVVLGYNTSVTLTSIRMTVPVSGTNRTSTYSYNGLQYAVLIASGQPLGSNGLQGFIDKADTSMIMWNVSYLCEAPQMTFGIYSQLAKYGVVPMAMVKPPGYLHNDESYRMFVSVNSSLEIVRRNKFECAADGYTCATMPYMQLNNGTSLLCLSIFPSTNLTVTLSANINVTLTMNGVQVANFDVASVFTNDTLPKTIGSLDIYLLANNTGPQSMSMDFAMMVRSSELTDYFYLPTDPFGFGTEERRSVKPVLGAPNSETTTMVLGWGYPKTVTLYEAVGTGQATGNFTTTYGSHPPKTVTITPDASTDVGFYSFQADNFVMESYKTCKFGNALSYDDMVYPFGVTSIASDQGLNMGLSFLASTYGQATPIQSALSCGTDSLSLFKFDNSNNLTDTTGPEVLSINFQRINATTYHLRAVIRDDISGFFQMILTLSTGDYIGMSKEDLVDGNALLGTYEQILMVKNAWDDKQFTISSITDHAFNGRIYDNGDDDMEGRWPLRTTTSPWDFDIEDITNFQFDNYTMDVSSGNMNNTLYFNSTKLDLNFIISFTYGHPEQNPLYQSFGGYYMTKGMFVIPFTVPARLTHVSLSTTSRLNLPTPME
ncbi:hypothetical protein SAMD00019534_057850 [Acytostelium subglobosum LB1]|uniref:hypothetical protein n=1 Tax=Acytostelium subglobosum LB1 TaxID=1410327 RepID=UPI000644EA02|nr:hypothetical protein SAMD00019534_057850 [Acytostelium subglobosum LB1]GAM22610.1 hypothetical protein SAMD00019534_057850 [Acytostelium subglobosum LB1]|eukprot:XP_012754730.1 hypothetical protein SAMD00019534_057850 [Acytostelium subglobosum LB1]